MFSFPDVDNVPGNMAPNLSLTAFVTVCSDTSFLLFLAGIF